MRYFISILLLCAPGLAQSGIGVDLANGMFDELFKAAPLCKTSVATMIGSTPSENPNFESAFRDCSVAVQE
jgi:hypothetical protein